MINKKIKQRWLKALRSGKYSQGFGELQSGLRRYCVLGLVRQVMNPLDEDSLEDENGMLTDEQRNRAGLSISECKLLSELNDTETHSFDDLADYIGTHL